MKLAVLSLALLLGGCMHSVHQVALGEFEPLPSGATSRPIEVETSQSVFIATGSTRFADDAVARLAERCPQGRVVGIQARRSTSLGFLVHRNRMKMTGLCVVEPREAGGP